MTNLTALQSVIGGNYPFDANMYEKALIDKNINSADQYTATNEKPIDLCVVGLIPTLIAACDIKEGGYSVTVADRAALLSLRSLLLVKYGLSDNSAFVKDASNVW